MFRLAKIIFQDTRVSFLSLNTQSFFIQGHIPISNVWFFLKKYESMSITTGNTTYYRFIRYWETYGCKRAVVWVEKEWEGRERTRGWKKIKGWKLNMRVGNDQDGGKSARRRWNAYKRGWKEITRVQREQEKRLGEN